MTTKKPPKYVIANGFAIRSFPDKIPYSSPDKVGEFHSIDMMNDINEVMKALVAPVNPLGYVFQHLVSPKIVFKAITNFLKQISNV